MTVIRYRKDDLQRLAEEAFASFNGSGVVIDGNRFRAPVGRVPLRRRARCQRASRSAHRSAQALRGGRALADLAQKHGVDVDDSLVGLAFERCTRRALRRSRAIALFEPFAARRSALFMPIGCSTRRLRVDRVGTAARGDGESEYDQCSEGHAVIIRLGRRACQPLSS